MSKKLDQPETGKEEINTRKNLISLTFDFKVSMACLRHFFYISQVCMILLTKKYFHENFSKILPPVK